MRKDKVVIGWRFHARIVSVWNAWTDPELIKSWFGSDPDGEGVSATVDLREGCGYEVTFRNADGAEYTCHGKYEKIEPPRRLDFTWAWKDKPEKVEFVSVTLTETGDTTEMRFEHRAIDQGTGHDYENGWKRTFGKLEKVLASG